MTFDFPSLQHFGHGCSMRIPEVKHDQIDGIFSHGRMAKGNLAPGRFWLGSLFFGIPVSGFFLSAACVGVS